MYVLFFSSKLFHRKHELEGGEAARRMKKGKGGKDLREVSGVCRVWQVRVAQHTAWVDTLPQSRRLDLCRRGLLPSAISFLLSTSHRVSSVFRLTCFLIFLLLDKVPP